MVTGHASAVVDGELDVIEAVEVVGIGDVFEIALELLKLIPPLRIGRADGRLGIDADRGIPAHPVLQVGLPEEGGSVADGSQNPDERVGVPIERPVVEHDTVSGRHPAGHDRRPVRHTDRIGHPGVVEHRPSLRQRIQGRRPNYHVAHETGVIGPLLIGDHEEDVRSTGPRIGCGHDANLD